MRKMHYKLLIATFLAIVFASCNYQFTPKEKESALIITEDSGNINAVGPIEYHEDGSISFTEYTGQKFRLRKYKAILYEYKKPTVVPPIQQKPLVKKPAPDLKKPKPIKKE